MRGSTPGGYWQNCQEITRGHDPALCGLLNGLLCLAVWVILAGFSPNSYESPAPMEIQPILNTIKDLTERSQSIRGYL